MISRFCLTGGIFGLMACSGVTEVAAPTPQLSDRQRFISAIEGNGCVINAGTIGPILAQASLSQQQLADLTVTLEGEGVLAPDGSDTVRLSSTNCI